MSLFGTGRREGILAVLLLMLLAVAVQSPAWLLGQHRAGIQPAAVDPARGPAAVDITQDMRAAEREAAVNQTVVLPAMERAGETLRRDEAPLWNRHNRFGEPFAVSGAPVHYPGFWPLLLPGGSGYLELVLALHGALAGMGIYRMLRAMTLTRYTGFLGGAAYGLGAFSLAAGDRLPEAAAAALLPMVLEATWRVLMKRERDKWIAPLGIWLGLMILTGGTTTAILGLMLSAALFCAHLRMLERSEWLHSLRSYGLAWATALCLSAPEWLTWWQLQGYLEPATAAAGHLQMGGFLHMVAPTALVDLQGNGPEALQSLNPGADPMELALYPGAGILFLLALGMFLPKRTWLGMFWVITGALGLAMTIDGPIGNVVRKVLMPGNQPGAGLVFFHLSVVVLGCNSLDNFLNAPLSRRFGVSVAAACTTGATLSLALLALLAPQLLATVLGRHAGDGAATTAEWVAAMEWVGIRLLITAVLFAAVSGLFLALQRLGILRFKTALITLLLFELVGMQLLCTARTTEATVGSPLAARLGPEDGLAVAAGRNPIPPMTWLQQTGGRVVGTEGRALLRGTSSFLRMVDPSAVSPGPRPGITPLAHQEMLDDPLLLAAGVDVALSRRPVLTRAFSPDSPGPAMEFARDNRLLHIALRDRRSTAARLHHDVVKVADSAEAARILHNLGARRGTALVVESAADGMPLAAELGLANAEVVFASANRIEIRIQDLQGNAWLSLAEAWAPGWRATVDGEATPVRIANLAFRAVPVPAGSESVVFEYRPWARTVGWPLAMLGVALLALIAVLAAVGILGPKRYGPPALRG